MLVLFCEVSWIVLLRLKTVSAQEMPMPKTASSQSDAQKAFEKLKTLAGSWQGNVMGMSVQATIRVTSRGNAVLHEMTASVMPDNPITMIYVDGDRLLLTHWSLSFLANELVEQFAESASSELSIRSQIHSHTNALLSERGRPRPPRSNRTNIP